MGASFLGTRKLWTIPKYKSDLPASQEAGLFLSTTASQNAVGGMFPGGDAFRVEAILMLTPGGSCLENQAHSNQ